MKRLVKNFFDKWTTVNDLKNLYKDSLIYSVHQTHSNICYEINRNDDPLKVLKIEADAMIEHDTSGVLYVKTADCLPILIYSKKLNCVAAVHAGWRGILNEVLSVCLKKIKSKYENLKDFEMHIGPHIQQSSFEVEEDVFIKFQKLAEKYSLAEFYFKQADKYFIDLQKFAIQQGIIEGLAKESILTSEVDTKVDMNYHSFRRDKQMSGRNISCIGFIKQD